MAIEKSPLEQQMEEARKKKNAPLTVKSTTGELVSFQPGSVGQAAQGLGIQQPTTPLSVAGIGMSPDSAKMAGTPNQLQGAQNLQLATAQRTAQGRQELTEEEKKKREKSANLLSLGQMGDRVQSLINSKLPAAGTTVQLGLAAGTTATDSLTRLQEAVNSGDKAAISTALADYVNAMKAEGKEVNLDDIKSIFGSPEEAIAALINDGLGDTITAEDVLDDATLSNMGFPPSPGKTPMQAFTEATGINPTGMSLSQFQTVVAQTVQQEYSEIERLKGVAFDPNSSMAERAAARQSLIDMGALGLTATEEAAHKMEQQVAEADQVEFAGGTHKMEDLLNDTYVSGLITAALQDPALLQSLTAQNRQLADFITENKDTLGKLSAELPGAVESFRETQTAYQNLSTMPDGSKLDKSVMDVLIPGYDPSKFTGEVPQFSGAVADLVKEDSTIPPEERTNIFTLLNTFGKQDPRMVAALNKLTADQLRQLANPPANSPDMATKYLEFLQNPTDPYLLSVFGGKGGVSITAPERLLRPDFVNKMKDALSFQALGLPPGSDKGAKLYQDKELRPLLEDGKLTENEILGLKLENIVDLANLYSIHDAIKKTNPKAAEALSAQVRTARGMQTDKFLKNTIKSAGVDWATYPSTKVSSLQQYNSATKGMKDEIKLLEQELASHGPYYDSSRVLARIAILKRNVASLGVALETVRRTDQAAYEKEAAKPSPHFTNIPGGSESLSGLAPVANPKKINEDDTGGYSPYGTTTLG